MGAISKQYSSESQIIGAGDGYATLSGVTETLSSDVDLITDGYMGAEVTVEVNFDSTPTDYVQVNIYPGRDASNYDDSPAFGMLIDKAIDPHQKTFNVDGYAHFKVGVVQTGSTDSHDVRAYVKRWKYSG
jgi:hypothetical protein